MRRPGLCTDRYCYYHRISEVSLFYSCGQMVYACGGAYLPRFPKRHCIGSPIIIVHRHPSFLSCVFSHHAFMLRVSLQFLMPK